MASGKNINPNKKLEGKIADPKERQAALNEALKKIEKSFGKGSVMKLGDSQFTKVQSTSTGSLKLDVALGIGGYPKGRIIEIYGPESSGKTTLALHAVAEAQRNGGIVAYIDAETWTLNTPRHWVLMLTNCCYHNQILVNKDWLLRMP